MTENLPAQKFHEQIFQALNTRLSESFRFYTPLLAALTGLGFAFFKSVEDYGRFSELLLPAYVISMFLLGGGITFVLSTSYTYRYLQLVLRALEKTELNLSRFTPDWDPQRLLASSLWTFSIVPEVLKVHFYMSLVTAFIISLGYAKYEYPDRLAIISAFVLLILLGSGAFLLNKYYLRKFKEKIDTMPDDDLSLGRKPEMRANSEVPESTGGEVELKDRIQRPNSFLKWCKEYAPSISAASSIVLAIINSIMIFLTYQSLEKTKHALTIAEQQNTRAEQLFLAKVEPVIDVVPTGIKQVEVGKDKYAETTFSVVNYTSFAAKNISINIKYGPYAWINEWVKADHDKSHLQGVITDKMYFFHPQNLSIPFLPGRSTQSAYVRGALTLESEVCQRTEPFPIFVRTLWHSENDREFDQVKEYRLVCTSAQSNNESGRAFTLLPKEYPISKEKRPAD